jgi:iron(III) transport system ATP-binding protein
MTDRPAGTGAGDVVLSGISMVWDSGEPVLHDVDLVAPGGRVLSLLGPSGCGKTTLLRVVAGLEVPGSGTVAVGGRVLTGGRAAPRPPERRGVGMVFQDGALFPTMTVAGNVAFGLPAAQRRRGEGVDATLELVGLGGMGDRSPATLSGGQQQRVALGRALAQDPSVLLLDEPFSNLDARLRQRVRTDVHRLLDRLGVTTILVTHDRDEAFVLGDRVAVMRDGRIVQVGTPEEVYAEPVDPWVAGFVGDVVTLPAVVSGGIAETPVGPFPVAGPDGLVEVLVRPEQIRLLPVSEGVAELAGASGDDSGWRVALVEFRGPETAYEVDRVGAPAGGADVAGSRRDDGAAAGAAVRVVAPGRPRFSRGDRVVLAPAAGATALPVAPVSQ